MSSAARSLLRPRAIRFRSLTDLNAATFRWRDWIQEEVGLIVGVPRSGLLAASLLAVHMGRPLCDMATVVGGADPWGGLRLPGGSAQSGRLLVVDDSVNSGTEMLRVRHALTAAGYDPVNLLFAAVYASPNGTRHVDFWAEVVPPPRAFAWNILGHRELLAQACMDIDGVLCREPLPRENDDGRRYLRFLAEAQPVFLPSFPVRTLVTSRLEKYRARTEDWLASHGVEYGELVMLDLPTARERTRRRAHASHKAAAYLESGNVLFYESSATEGREIHSISRLPVYVTDTHEFLGVGGTTSFKEPLPRRVLDSVRLWRATRGRSHL